MWEEVYREPTDIMERMRLTDGWLYRNRVVADGSLQSAGGYDWDVVITYVPGPLPPPVNVAVPAVTGTGAIGETLTCTMGEWQNDPDDYFYEWLSDGVAVGDEHNTYLVDAADAGKAITCVVTATNASGSTAAPGSNAITIP